MFPKSVLICPQNDPESLTITRIAQTLGIRTLVSTQPHGARLENEPKLLAQLINLHPHPNEVVIVEIPGPEVEMRLMKSGYNVVIIDHHRYEDLNRMKNISSLEQFLDHFKITSEDLITVNFDPLLIQGVADIDQGFVWRLFDKSYKSADIERIIKYYKQLLLELGGERRLQAEQLALQVFENKEVFDDFLVFRNSRPDIGVRDPISFLIAEKINFRHPSVIIEPNGIYVQETHLAPKLHETFGGFTFGGDMCWGKRGNGEEIFEDIKKILKKSPVGESIRLDK
jgi:hypothetical protein